MEEKSVKDGAVVAIRELASGVAVIVLAAFAACVLFRNPSPAGRVLVFAAATGMLAALFTDWRARLGVTIASVLAFVGFAGPAPEASAGEPALWSYTPLIGLAAMLGCGYRVIAQSTAPTLAGGSAGSPEQLDQTP